MVRLVGLLSLLCTVCAYAHQVISDKELRDSLVYRPLLNVRKLADGPKIVGGKVADKNDFKFMANMRLYSNPDYNFCGGMVVGESTILTAAHCCEYMENKGPGKVHVKGNVVHKDGVEKFPIESMLIHPQYDNYLFDYDVCLIFVDDKIKQKPVKLSKKYYSGKKGDTTTITGWGKRDFDSDELMDKLHVVQVDLVTNERCSIVYPGEITDQMICAGKEEGGKDTCQGDSGGPIMVKKNDEYEVIGITSWGYGCAEPGYYGVYARMSELYDWIQERIDKKHEQTPVPTLSPSQTPTQYPSETPVETPTDRPSGPTQENESNSDIQRIISRSYLKGYEPNRFITLNVYRNQDCTDPAPSVLPGAQLLVPLNTCESVIYATSGVPGRVFSLSSTCDANDVCTVRSWDNKLACHGNPDDVTVYNQCFYDGKLFFNVKPLTVDEDSLILEVAQATECQADAATLARDSVLVKKDTCIATPPQDSDLNFSHKSVSYHCANGVPSAIQYSDANCNNPIPLPTETVHACRDCTADKPLPLYNIFSIVSCRSPTSFNPVTKDAKIVEIPKWKYEEISPMGTLKLYNNV